MEKPIDIIIPYVNCWDPKWLALATTNLQFIKYSLFRDLNTIKYFFRGVETNLPWVRYVYLILQSPSQIPAWLNVNHPQLKIIYHSDYIPAKYLPTYNSNVIELFYHKIKGLSKHFIVANDDMVAIQPLKTENFFKNGKIVYNQLKQSNFTLNDCKTHFDLTLYNTSKATGKITGRNNCVLYEHKHLFTPHLKSLYKFGWKKYKHGLIESFKHSKERTSKNIIHYLFLFLAEELKLVENDKTSPNGYVTLFDNTKPEEIIRFFNENKTTVCCLNDKFKCISDANAKQLISDILDVYLPNPSKFEI